ncbi:MAG: ribonuclease D [Gemmatimonadaceae bacterium]|nr:ribonuclease D [Gemmatimonadaceae bacterium]
MARPDIPHDALYLDTHEELERFERAIAHTKQVALDTEGASFHRFVDRVYLLQLSTREHHAVIDPLPIGTPAGIGKLAEDPGVEVVFHDADYDLRLLQQDYGWHIRNIFDTRIAAQLLGYKAFGLAALLEKHFGVTLDKKHQRADWSMRPLTTDMLAYAAQDTMYLLDLRDKLHHELAQKGRLEWAKEEFARLEGTRWEPEDPSLGFLRIKGARDLDRRELALFRELVQWRDALAKELDRSTFRVVGNETLMEISRTRPADAKALMSIKGMPRGIGERHASEILDAVARGLAVPDADLPRFPRAPRWDKDPDFDARVSALRTVRDEAAKRLDLDPGVLGSRDRLEAIARRVPRSVEELSEIPELRRWQIAEFGDAAVAAIASLPNVGGKANVARGGESKDAEGEGEESGGGAGDSGSERSRPRRRGGRGRRGPGGGSEPQGGSTPQGGSVSESGSAAPGGSDPRPSADDEERSPYRDG